jgi:hypothetical protein
VPTIATTKTADNDSPQIGVQDFIKSVWPRSAVGFVLGAAVGFLSPTMARFGETLAGRFPASAIVVWPKHALVTLIIVLCVGAALCSTLLAPFLRKLWTSWRAGLLHGIGFAWFLTSVVTFALLSFTGSSLCLFVLALGFGITAATFLRDGAVAKRRADPSSENDSDDAILTPDQDILGRGAVVRSLVRAVVNDRTPVLALTGTYGDGKTSVLNLLEGELKKRTDLVCVRFSTWLPMDGKTLVFTLFTSILSELEKTLSVLKIDRDLAAVARLLFAIWPKTHLVELVEKPSQEQQIKELCRSLAKLPVRVVVFLDDMDRMGKDELNVVLKLLRGVREFPQFTYVCAFDHNALVQIIRTNDSEESRVEAERFLEKFLPEVISLPKIEDARLALEFEKRLRSICDRNNIATELRELKDRLTVLWQVYLKAYLSNLRRVKLLTNRLSRSLPFVAGEVNLRDFILLEIVRMINPIIYEEIFRNSRYFVFTQWRTTSWVEIVHPEPEEEQKRRNGYFDTLFEGLARPPEGTLLALLGEIFPMVNSYLGGTSTPLGLNSEKAQRTRRVFHPDFFPRYFIFNVPADLFGEHELSAFVDAMNETGNPARGAAVFRKKYEELTDQSMKRWDFLRRVAASIDSFNRPAMQGLVSGLSELSDRLEDAGAAGGFDALTASKIVFAIANKLDDGAAAQNILQDVIKGAVSDGFATRVLNECESNANRLLRPDVVVHKGRLRELFAHRMSVKYLSGSGSTFFPEQRLAKSDFVSLGRWALCGTEGRDEVRQYLETEFQSAPWKVGRFLSYFFPFRDEPPGMDALKAIEIYFSPERLVELLDKYRNQTASSPEDIEAVQEFKGKWASRQQPTS